MVRNSNSGNADVIGHFLKMIRMMLVPGQNKVIIKTNILLPQA